ncbi:restriction endonuclease [Nesterenkonia sp. AN1]|uniref:5-methylcytosine-specific restriction enzyme subunit McrC n=1 Tax=Nesterenkonia aurantiaca TaxID=1436010 RepID=A0A4R7FZR7_9MICC|nr:hypothetical protein [Nesterenkonia]EXF25797.1 restriction endonuclease [Nesterenkonia sp. AN1]TDS84256.1 5-methylcytosine-specific restriction enzyme subunit McrC [Nesterenkonia aurantiaca]
MNRLDLTENGKGVVLALSEDLVEALTVSDLIDVWPERHGQWLLKPKLNRVGALRAGQMDVVVHPKAPFHSLFFMISYARHPSEPADVVSGSADDDLWSSVAKTLVLLSRRALDRGLLHGYVSRDDSLMTVKGRLRLSDQLARHGGMPVPLEVSYDEFTTDIAENQILLAALQRMVRVPRLSPSVRAELSQLIRRLHGIEMIHPAAPLPPWTASRKNRRYLPALDLAETILQSTGLSLNGGHQNVASMTYNMADVFENFLFVAIRESLRGLGPGSTRDQYRTVLDTDRTVPIRPDIVHTLDGRPVAVADVKYKVLGESSGVPAEDVYQVLAYCTALGLHTGHLIHVAKSNEVEGPRRIHITGSSITIQLSGLNVTVEPAGLLDQIRLIAERVHVKQRTTATVEPVAFVQ